MGLVAEGDAQALGMGLVLLPTLCVWMVGDPEAVLTFSRGRCRDVGKGHRRRWPGKGTSSSLAIGQGNSPLLC